MLYENYVGKYHNNSVASFGINLSLHQFKILEEIGVEEIVVAFDRQYKEPCMTDPEFKRLTDRLSRLHDRFSGDNMTISFMMDDGDLLEYRDSPIDQGIDVFNELYQNRFTLKREAVDK